MIVFIGGMMRSGSTFTFNVARSLLTKRGSVFHEPNPDLIGLLARAEGYNHLLFKAHSLDPATANLAKLGALKVILTVRKPEDSIASLIRTFAIPLDQSIVITRDWLANVAAINSHSLTLPYELIDLNPRQAVDEIANYLIPSASTAERDEISAQNEKKNVKQRSDALDEHAPEVKHIGFSYYDQETYYHRRHISSLKSEAAVDLLPASDIAKIRSELSQFVDTDGNLRNKLASVNAS